MAPSWRDLVADKKRRQLESIPKDWIIPVPGKDVLDVTRVPSTCGLLSATELQITETKDVDVLLAKLASGHWSAVEVTTAFCKRAVVAHQLVNCLTEILIDRALARAAELDEHLKTTGKPVGPLHGLPVSLKDQFHVKGVETTMGYASWVGRVAERDSAMVELLLQAGAIPYVKTNVPQTLLWVETMNLVFGRTVNPYNRSLTAGGSSGGEGALIALHGSALGVATDHAGSIIIPATFNGLYGLKASSGRLPYYGAATSLSGQEASIYALGPISSSLSGLKTFMKALLGEQPWRKDPRVVRKKWNDEEYALADHGGGKHLCFAIMWHDGIVTPHPPIRRALELTKKALLEAGHLVIDWQPVNHHELGTILNHHWGAGSREDLLSATAATGEPLLSSLNPEDEQTGLPYFAATDGISAYELWQHHKTRTEMRKKYLDHWESTAPGTGTGRPVDAIICPGAASAAPPHGKNAYLNYTRVWNVLDRTTSAFPVTRVNLALDKKPAAHEFLSPLDKFYYELCKLPVSRLVLYFLFDALIIRADEPSVFENMPVGLQLVGQTLEEEAVIAMTEIVVAALRASQSRDK
ncbi:general amidase [Daedalea quercina L-15889]|uniref:General amidase n=1 Tax=Daedalea quercina L-15889 TaxID=1314783 RepID=A0A165N3X3_9APHY|nr:general amidase [Daedalea quercina L-15889]